MTERKVLNKYYPPDFDPSKLPRLRLQKNRQFNVRIMAPCNMKCNTCGEYIYKGKKFNSRQETVDGESYLGLRIYRFYIKCPRCMSEITFKTNLEEMDYELEHGATRNFQAVRLAEQQAEKVEEARIEEEKSNPMVALERRTQDSRFEMDRLEALEELKDLNTRQANINYDEVIKMTVEKEMQELKRQEDEDEAFIKSIFSNNNDSNTIKRLHDSDSSDEEEYDLKKMPVLPSSNVDPLTSDSSIAKKPKTDKDLPSWEKSVGSLRMGKGFAGIVIKPKQPTETGNPPTASPSQLTRVTATSAAVASSSSGKPQSAKASLCVLAQYGSSSEEE
ncbi:splicing factor YJU2-like [Paramacrobiotus metropolitanus]|uniref:splicing factor YJU2-like n=1 Tax=Paramacrobiotus metropolitanus TaxID=2943436 RepID=UPI002445D337|nr:splicing factor YJU2-like [Paramacrobiotus metropolitanus]